MENATDMASFLIFKGINMKDNGKIHNFMAKELNLLLMEIFILGSINLESSTDMENL